MFRLYRKIERGEFFLVGGDCSQGGADSNVASFFSATKLDFPLIYKAQGVASNMTEAVHPVLEWLFDQTGIKSTVAFERQMGGASEMDRLVKLNRNGKYDVFIMPKIGTDDSDDKTNQYGWNTSSVTRPILIGDYKDAFDNKLFKHYDQDFVSQHKTFIVNKQGKPEAATGTHDDCVISPAIAWQLYQRVPTRKLERVYEPVPYRPSDDVIGI